MSRQLEPACSKVLFQCKRLKAEYRKIKGQFLVVQEFLHISRLPLFGRVWSFATERFSLDASVRTIRSYVMACAFSNIYVCVCVFKGGPSTEEGDVILLVSFLSAPVLEFAVTGLKGQRACLFFDKERITRILVISGNGSPCVPSLPPALFKFSLSC